MRIKTDFREEQAKGSKERAVFPAPKSGGQDQDRAQVQAQGAQAQGARVQAQGVKAEAQGTRTQSFSASAFSVGRLV